MATIFDTAGMSAFISEYYGEHAYAVVVSVNPWLTRGDGIAVYRNEDLGHRELGHVQMVSYGSPAALLETDTPPEQMPDIGHSINWRYRLHAMYRGETLSVPDRPDDWGDPDEDDDDLPEDDGPSPEDYDISDPYDTEHDIP